MPRSFKVLFLLILMVLFGNSITLYYYTSILMDKEKWISHTFQVMAHIESLRADLKTAGISVRNFVISDEDVFLQDFYVSKDKLLQKLDDVRKLTADNPEQQTRISGLRSVIMDRLTHLEQLAEINKTGSATELGAYFKANFRLNEIRRADELMADMTGEEDRLLHQRFDKSQQHLRILNVLVGIILLLDVVFVGLIYLFFHRYLMEKRQAEQLFRAFFDQAAIGIEGVSPQGLVLKSNPKLGQMLGYRIDEIIGMELQDTLHPNDLPTVIKNDERLFSGEIPSYSMELRYRKKDGSYVWTLSTASAVRQSEDRPAYRLSIIQDITDRKLADDEKRHLLEESQTANRLKDEFLLTVSHELRTPLTIVLGHIELLEFEEPGSKDFHDSLAAVKRGAKAQARLVDDLLDISAIASGKMQLKISRVDVNSVLEGVVSSFRQTSSSRGISLNFHPEQHPVWIQGDEVRLQQIFWNLISNAFKFTDRPGRVMIEIREGSQGAMVKVSDTGKGIDAKFLPYVFQPFRQEDGSMTRHHGGLGLGMAIAQRLVEYHGGTLEVNSPGSSYGTTFTAFFPIFEKMDVGSDVIERRDDLVPQQIPPDLLKGHSFLVIEDESDARQLFSMSLKMAGADVEAVGKTAEGFDKIKEKRFDAIISDIGLPLEDGYTFMKKIRAFEQMHQTARIKAVAISAHAHSSDREKALAAGYDSHIPKPINPHHFLKRISDVLNVETRQGTE